MELFEVENRLREILSEFDGFGNFTIHTMAIVGERAREVRTYALKILGEEDEVTGEMESAILLSKEYHRKKLGIETDLIKSAIMHLEYGVDLFREKI